MINMFFSRYEKKSDLNVKTSKAIDTIQKKSVFDELVRATLCVNIRIGIQNTLKELQHQAGIHHKTLSIWFKALGLYYTIHAWSSLGLFWTSCCCPVQWRSCSPESTGPPPPHPSPSCSTDHRWGRCWAGLTHNPGSGPGFSSPLPSLPGWALLHCPGQFTP